MQTMLMKFYSASIGKKVVMAMTGTFLFLFVIVHMLGNLQVFSVPEKLNPYAHFLKSTTALLWATRIILFLTVTLHITTGIQLYLQNRRSRPVPYGCFTPEASTFSSRNMIWTGALIAFFVMYHLLHLTTGTLHPSFDEQDVYHNVIAGFSQLTVSTGYIVAMIVLGLHLLHGTWSMFQSLGLTYPKYNAWRRLFATGMTIILALGNITMPLIILAKHW